MGNGSCLHKNIQEKCWLCDIKILSNQETAFSNQRKLLLSTSQKLVNNKVSSPSNQCALCNTSEISEKKIALSQ